MHIKIMVVYNMNSNYLRRILCIYLSALLIAGCCACSFPGNNPKNADVHVYATDSFQAFTDDLFVDEVTSDSITLNYLLAHPENYGIESYDVTYGSTDISLLDDDSQTIQALKSLKSFKYQSLTEGEQLTYDILKDYLETYLEYSDLYLYDKTLSPTIGFNCQLPVVLAEYSFRTTQDVYDYVELLKQTDEYFQFLLELEKMKSEKGIFMMDEIADMIIEQCNNFTKNPEENYLIEIFDGKVDAMEGFSADEKSNLKAENKAAILEHVIPAYTLLAEGLTALKGTGKYDGGLCNYPDGGKYYEYLVRSGTGSSRSIEEIEELIDDYMKLGYRKMGTALRENPDVLDSASDYSFGIDDPYDILEDLQKRIQKDFPALPETSYTIKYVHKSLEDNMSPAFYMTPAIDDYSENSIYINNKSLEEGQELYTTLAHEGFPGHLYQTVYTASKNLAPVRSILNFPGYTEGWATYVELLSYEMGAIDETLGSLLSANQLIVLGLYAKCDIGVNYHGWTLDDVSSYVESLFGDLGDDVMEEIYYSMVSEPANYLKYVVGCMEFMELRQTAEDTHGDRFDPVAFHDFIMTTGPAPFDIIQNRMESWMNQ